VSQNETKAFRSISGLIAICYAVWMIEIVTWIVILSASFLAGLLRDSTWRRTRHCCIGISFLIISAFSLWHQKHPVFMAFFLVWAAFFADQAGLFVSIVIRGNVLQWWKKISHEERFALVLVATTLCAVYLEPASSRSKERAAASVSCESHLQDFGYFRPLTDFRSPPK
jgi:hypothetical protein